MGTYFLNFYKNIFNAIVIRIHKDSLAKAPDQKENKFLGFLDIKEASAPIKRPIVIEFGINNPPKTITGLIFNFLKINPYKKPKLIAYKSKLGDKIRRDLDFARCANNSADPSCKFVNKSHIKKPRESEVIKSPNH